MNLNDIRVLYLREIRSALRDRTIVTNSILLPIFLYPVMIWLVYTGFTFISGQNEELKSRIMLKDLPAAHAILKKEFEADKSVVIMHPAIDSTAGERENSTWETVMTVATARGNVLVAKFLYVATMAFTAAFLNLFAMMFSMGTILSPIFGGQGNSSVRIPFQSA